MAKTYLFHPLKRVKKFVTAAKGNTMKVWFLKDDETLRKMKCHIDLNYKPKPLAEGKTRKQLPESSVFVFDEEKEEYRSFRADRVIYMLMIGGQRW